MRFVVFFLWLIHFLPFPILGRLGRLLGTISYYFLKERREVTLINLRLCFPNMAETERKNLAKEHFQCYARSIVERSILWWAPRERIEKLIHMAHPFPIEDVKSGPVIFLCPHFVCLEVPGVVVTFNTVGSSMYMPQKNQIFDELLKMGRMRFNPDTILFKRRDGIKPIVRALRKNIPYYMLPDLDFGMQDAEFIPFFGELAATLTAPARLAELVHAKVIPTIATFLPNYEGWKVEFCEPLENFPGSDAKAATERINHLIESLILEHPAEYLWTHRRFKTRPPGEPPFYPEKKKK